MKELLEQASQLKQKLKNLELDLKQTQIEYDDINQQVLHKLLEAGMLETKTPAGDTFRIKAKYSGGISIENAFKAEEIFHKHNLEFPFRVEIQGTAANVMFAADKARSEAVSIGEVKPDMHHATYKKIIRELDEGGQLSDDDKNILGIVKTMEVDIKLA